MRRTLEEAQKTRISILNAAARVFARSGLDGTTLGEIAAEAGVTRGAVYWYFKDKQDLFEQILKQEDARLDMMIETELGRDHSPLTRLKGLLEKVVDNFYDNVQFRQQIFMSWYRLNPKEFEPLMKKKSIFVQGFLVLMEDLLKQARSCGELKDHVDIHQSAYHLSCLINGFYRLYHVAPDWASDKGMTWRLFAVYLESLKS